MRSIESVSPAFATRAFASASCSLETVMPVTRTPAIRTIRIDASPHPQPISSTCSPFLSSAREIIASIFASDAASSARSLASKSSPSSPSYSPSWIPAEYIIVRSRKRR